MQDEKKVKKKQNCEHVRTMALPPTTVTQTQCCGVYGLATFSHGYLYEKTMEDGGGHLTILNRIKRHTQKQFETSRENEQLENKPCKSSGNGRRQRADNEGQRADGRGQGAEGRR